MKEIINIPGEQESIEHRHSVIGFQPFTPWYTIMVQHDDPYNKDKYVIAKKNNEYNEAKGTLIWIPLIKRVVCEAADSGFINRQHIPLFENILFGLTAVETCGRFAQTGNFGNTKFQVIIGSFRGLGQMVAEKHYLEENPYDPLTALRISLRNTLYLIYYAKNVEAAMAEHNNGKIGIKKSRVGVDAFTTIGQEFVMRVVNAAWWGYYLLEKGDCYTGIQNYNHQFDSKHPNARYYRYSPPWDFLSIDNKGDIIIREPDLPFNWEPPSTSLAYKKLCSFPGSRFMQKLKEMKSCSIKKNVWKENIIFKYPKHFDSGKNKSECRKLFNGTMTMLKSIIIPDWFYNKSIPHTDTHFELRKPTEKDRSVFPCGCKGKTPAATAGKKHNLYIEDGDPIKDCIGRDENGKWYCFTKDSFREE